MAPINMVKFTELQWLCINIVGSYKIFLTVCSLDILLQLAVEPELWHDPGTELSVLRWSCSSAHSTVQSSFLQQRALVPNITVTHTARIKNSIWSYSVWATTRPAQYSMTLILRRTVGFQWAEPGLRLKTCCHVPMMFASETEPQSKNGHILEGGHQKRSFQT